MTTLFISDLHLEPGRPEITRLFLDFLDGEASEAESLYILGDLFEYWIGDDAKTPLANQVGEGLRVLSRKGIAVHFMHGNRDFLLGEQFADQAGMNLLPQVFRLDLYGTATLLLHGDSLCIDDIEYQEFRAMVRDSQWQEQFLQLSIDERLEMATLARDASKTHTGSSPMEIMDVNQQAVEGIMQQHQASRLIHGHTHRPAVHQLSVAGKAGERIVLGDWYQHGSVLRVDQNHVDLAALPLEARP